MRQETIEALREVFEIPDCELILIWEVEEGSDGIYELLAKEENRGQKHQSA